MIKPHQLIPCALFCLVCADVLLANIQTGLCDQSVQYPSVCMKLSANSQFLKDSNNSRLSRGLNFVSGYTGIHIHRYFSLHAKGMHQKDYDLLSDVQEERKIVDLAIVQVGNLAYQNTAIHLGSMDPAFGLNHNTTPYIVQKTYEVDLFKTDYNRTAKISYDNLLNAGLELSASYAVDKKKDKGLSKDVLTAVRIHYIINALNGTKVVFSGRHLGTKSRSYSVAFYNTAVDGARTSFEFFRTTTRRELFASEQSMTRISYQSNSTKKDSSEFKYEGLTDHYRTLQVTSYSDIYKNLRAGLSLGHYFSGGKYAKYDNHSFASVSVEGYL